MQPGRADHAPDHRGRAEPRAPRLAGRDGRRAGARAQQPRRGRAARGGAAWPKRSRSSTPRSARFVEAGVERARRPPSSSRCSARRSRAPATAQPLDALDAADAEDELLERLEDLGVAEPWRVAEPLAAAGVDADWLERVAGAGRSGDRRRAGLGRGDAHRPRPRHRAPGVDRAACPTLVGAVKSYAYMDRGELVEVDLHEGIETTLAVLGHKLKHTRSRSCATTTATLPKLTVRGSELNQVWTNLLDNAIDALGDTGTITITTRRDGDCALVEITDDGPGIAARRRRAHLRPLLHDQGRRPGHRARAGDRAPDRRRPPRRHADRSSPARARRVPRLAAARGDG